MSEAQPHGTRHGHYILHRHCVTLKAWFKVCHSRLSTETTVDTDTDTAQGTRITHGHARRVAAPHPGADTLDLT